MSKIAIVLNLIPDFIFSIMALILISNSMKAKEAFGAGGLEGLAAINLLSAIKHQASRIKRQFLLLLCLMARIKIVLKLFGVLDQFEQRPGNVPYTWVRRVRVRENAIFQNPRARSYFSNKQ